MSSLNRNKRVVYDLWTVYEHSHFFGLKKLWFSGLCKGSLSYLRGVSFFGAQRLNFERFMRCLRTICFFSADRGQKQVSMSGLWTLCFFSGVNIWQRSASVSECTGYKRNACLHPLPLRRIASRRVASGWSAAHSSVMASPAAWRADVCERASAFTYYNMHPFKF